MRKTIQNLSLGNMSEIRPIIRFSEDKAYLVVSDDNECEGKITIESINHIPIRGSIFCDEPAIKLSMARLDGYYADIIYSVDPSKLRGIDKLEGQFVFVLNGGEYYLDYEILFSKANLKDTSDGITSIDEFVSIAVKDYKSALRIFYSDDMKQLIKKEDIRLQLLYLGLYGHGFSLRNVEEFMLAANLKDKINISLSESNKTITQDMIESSFSIDISKSGWGYIVIELRCDSKIVLLEKNSYNSDDFVDDKLIINYQIDAAKLHVGRNYETINIITPYQELEYSLLIYGQMNNLSHIEENIKEQKLNAKLLRCFLDYRFGRISPSDWISASLKDIEIISPSGNKRWFFKLYEAMMLIFNREKMSGKAILDEFDNAQERHTNSNLAFAVYIQGLLDTDRFFVQKQTDRLRRLYNETDNGIAGVFQVLLSKGIENDAERIIDIETLSLRGNTSPILYQEAYFIIKESPYLLTKLGVFEIRLFCWMKKEGLFDENAAKALSSLSIKISRFDIKIRKLLKECYEMLGTDETLLSYVRYLIQGRCFSSEEFEIYCAAAKRNLNINRLYEAIIYSADEKTKTLPINAYYYFQMEGTLYDQQRAKLYRILLGDVNVSDDIYEAYLPMIREFAIEQITQDHIDENLGAIYEKVFTKNEATQEIKSHLALMIMRYSYVSKIKNAIRVYVLQDTMKDVRMFAVDEGRATITLYPGKAVYILEDSFGRLYADESAVITPLLNRGWALAVCRGYADDSVYNMLFDIVSKKNIKGLEEKALRLCAHEDISDYYKDILRKQLSSYLTKIDDVDKLKNSILSAGISANDVHSPDELFEMYISSSDKEGAYNLLLDNVHINVKLDILEDLIALKCAADSSEDKTLISLSLKALDLGTTRPEIISYLCHHYEGDIARMISIYGKAKKMMIKSEEICERILKRVIFTDADDYDVDEVFGDYYEAKGNQKLILAVLNRKCYLYISQRCNQIDAYLSALENMCIKRNSMTKIVRLSLLKCLALSKSLNAGEEKILDEMLSWALSEDIYFPFYDVLPQELKRRHMLEGINVILYNGEQKDEVYAYIKEKSGIKVLKLFQVISGVYTYPLVVYEDEQIEYKIIVIRRRVMTIEYSGIIKGAAIKSKQSSRVARVQALRKIKDANMLKEAQKKYLIDDKRVREEFTLL